MHYPAVVLDALAHIARADDILLEDERAFLTDILHASGQPQSDWDRWLARTPEFPPAGELAAALPEEGSRRKFMEQMVRLADVDEHHDEEEWRVLARVCEALSIPAKDWSELDRWLKAAS